MEAVTRSMMSVKKVDEFESVDLMSFYTPLSDDLLWNLSGDVTGEVPEGTDETSLDLIPQPSYPSPNYETDEALAALDPYLSPRSEEAMDFTMTDEPASRTGLRGGNEDDNLAMGSVSFDDLLDENYGLPIIDNEHSDVNQEIENFLNSKSLDDIFVEELCTDKNANVTRAEPSYSSSDEDQISVGDTFRDADSSRDPDYVPEKTSGQYNFRQRNDKDKVECPPKKFMERQPSNVIVVKSIGQRLPTRNPRQNVRTVSPVESVNSNDAGFESVEDKSRKNAIQARLNRQKKKAYISGLEEQVTELSKENKQLASESSKMKKDMKSLEQEVSYLRNVLANDSALAEMISGINNNEGGVKLSSSFRNDRKRNSSEMDHDYGRPSKNVKGTPSKMSGGVCLHVDKNDVSLEFCSKCARMSRGASQSEVS